MKAVVILLDSLNRRFLSAYGAHDPAITPNIDRLAARGVVFDGHFCGSAPCMPARRDMMTGRLNFLERPWGGIEPFDQTLPALLKTNNVYTRIETDHYLYSIRGGEDYLADFTAWRMHRGSENDTCYWTPDRSGIRKPEVSDCTGKTIGSYIACKARNAENPDNFSTCKVMRAAADFLEENHDADNFLLWAEGFDPHEPFDVPDEYLALYGVTPRPDLPYWPAYTTADQYPEEQVSYFRALYKALLSMTDRHIGRILDVLDKHDMWKDTMVILTTDHGFMLGEHGYLAKNYMPDYNEVYHLPCIMAAPGVLPGRTSALTQNIDLLPTLLTYFDVPLSRCKNPIHGRNLWPILTGGLTSVRDAVLFGTFGKTVNMTDGRYAYLRRTDSPTNEPLYLYGASMNLMRQSIGFDTMDPADFSKIEMGRFLPWTDYPVYRVPARCVHWANNSLRFDKINDATPSSLLFDLENDYAEEHPLNDPALQERCAEKLRRLMRAHDCPAEQFTRLGL